MSIEGSAIAPIAAGDRPASLGVCLRWLPVWLPGISLLSLRKQARRLTADITVSSPGTGRRHRDALL
jgi:hypothetical protein